MLCFTLKGISLICSFPSLITCVSILHQTKQMCVWDIGVHDNTRNISKPIKMWFVCTWSFQITSLTHSSSQSILSANGGHHVYLFSTSEYTVFPSSLPHLLFFIERCYLPTVDTELHAPCSSTHITVSKDGFVFRNDRRRREPSRSKCLWTFAALG